MGGMIWGEGDKVTDTDSQSVRFLFLLYLQGRIANGNECNLSPYKDNR
jgi:hypothetical protein